MAASDHLNLTLFHGSYNPNWKPGDLLDRGTEKDSKDKTYIHSTPNHNWAGMYGHVYEVEPTDPSKLENWGDTEGLTPKTPEQKERQRIRYAPVPQSDQPHHEYGSSAPMRVVRRRPDLDYPKGHEYNSHDFASYQDKKHELKHKVK